LTLNGTVPAAFSGHDQALATTGADCNTVFVTDASSGRQRARVLSANGCVKALALSPDGTRLLSIRSDLQVDDFISEATVWDVRSGTVAAMLNGYTDHGNSAAAFSPDGKTIVTAGIGGTVNLWDPVGGRRLLTLAGPAVDVAAVAFSDAGDVLIGGYKTELRFWRGTSQKR
jgi:WD40 repeat protein